MSTRDKLDQLSELRDASEVGGGKDRLESQSIDKAL